MLYMNKDNNPLIIMTSLHFVLIFITMVFLTWLKAVPITGDGTFDKLKWQISVILLVYTGISFLLPGATTVLAARNLLSRRGSPVVSILCGLLSLGYLLFLIFNVHNYPHWLIIPGLF